MNLSNLLQRNKTFFRQNFAFCLSVTAYLLFFFELIPFQKFLPAAFIQHNLLSNTYNNTLILLLWTLLTSLLVYLVSLLSPNKYIFKLLVITVCTPIILYSCHSYMTENPTFRLNAVVFGFIANTNLREALEFISNSKVNGQSIASPLLLRISGFLLLIVLYPIQLKEYSIKNRILKSLAVATLFYSLYSLKQSDERILSKNNAALFKISLTEFPLENISTIAYRYWNAAYAAKVNNFQDLTLGNTFTDTSTNSESIVVLFIGESARGDRFSLNGYPRETNPNLKRAKGLLLSFPHARSCRMSTSLSVSCILTGHDDDQTYFHWPSQSSIISFFKKSGYKVFIGSTGDTNLFTPFEPELKDVKFTANRDALTNSFKHNSDLDLVNMVEDFLLDPAPKKFIILNGMGSHYDYKQRVPEKYRLTDNFYKNDKRIINSQGAYCNTLNGRMFSEINDDYDATISYTDEVLWRITEILNQKNSFMIYTSDHGESFGERGGMQPCLHGYNAPEVWHVPFLFWGSDIFLASNQKALSNLSYIKQINGENLVALEHKDILPSLLGCAHIETSVKFRGQNICSNAARKMKNRFASPWGCARFSKESLNYDDGNVCFFSSAARN